jgi:hypothetical protein
MRTSWIGRRSFPRASGAGDTFDGLPADVWQVHTLQQKTSWSDQDHVRIRELTRRWSEAQRRRYEQRWNWGRPARWR